MPIGSFVPGAWVRIVVYPGKAGQAQMGVALGCGEPGVAKELLHGAKIRSSLQKMGGEAVSQCVGTDSLLHPGGA